jgi:predicted 2-oxoglutarate/Fe(II)-dependent dioxygenase YbiX
MKTFDEPYTHIRVLEFLTYSEHQAVWDSVKKLKWELYDRGSYKYKVSSIDYESEFYVQNQAVVEKFVSNDFITTLSYSLDIQLKKCVDFCFHKMNIGDFSQKHTDKNEFGQLARIIYYVSDPYDYEGGDLRLFDLDGQTIYEEFKMPANSLFGFRLTDDFFHEVNIIYEGVRFCICITYS